MSTMWGRTGGTYDPYLRYRNGMTYTYVESLMYAYTNETIAWTENKSISQDPNSTAPITDQFANMDSWTKIENPAKLRAERSPTIPSVAGTSSIVLSPHTIENWKFDKEVLSTITPSQRLDMGISGSVAPERVSEYRVRRIVVTFIPFASEVDYSTLLSSKDFGESEGLMFQRKYGLEKNPNIPDTPAERSQRKDAKRGITGTLRTGSSSANDRNPTISTGNDIVYGCIINTFSSSGTSGGDDGGNVPGNPDVIVKYLPATYNGLFPEIISYVNNPNDIYSMDYGQFFGGGFVKIRTNIDSVSFEFLNPKPYAVAKTIDGVQNIKGPYGNDWVNINDTTITFGALAICVPKYYLNVVGTYQVKETVGENGAVKKSLVAGPKNMGTCLITWDFEFRLN